eukprot:CAMPEP_0118904914 /NCGR_PEP_ID=MMETSP1166-20130328/9185_1 /TAXON_ID=1104430 /ORGANISM="Chrysoreinhardia sp, Strain CCMP3193" /LENGTH=441 /DNA_ID=CAMNT_0006844183 /DNA_START=28 /DNA_END=1353 /DNA_ORIENTATION=+
MGGAVAGPPSLSELSALVARGKFAEASALSSSLPESEAPAVEAALASGLSSWRQTLSEIVGFGVVFDVTAPAFRWAQSDDAIFLEIKFSPTMSAPASTDAAVDAARVGGRSLQLSASAPSRGKRYELGLTFWGDVEATPDAKADVSAGRATLALKKETNSRFRWPRLQGCDVTPPANAGLWLDMQEAHGFSEEDDDDEDDDDDDGPCPTLEAKLAAATDKKQNRGKTTKKKTTKTTTKTTKTTTNKKKQQPEKKKKKETKRTTTKEAATTTTTTTTKGRDDDDRSRLEAEIAALKKKAGVARKAVTDQMARAKKKLDGEAAALRRKIRDDVDARATFCATGGRWAADLPKRLAVRDTFWDVFRLVSDAHRTKATDDLKRRATKEKTRATTILLLGLAACLLLPRFLLLRCLCVAVILLSALALVTSTFTLRAIDGFRADFS